MHTPVATIYSYVYFATCVSYPIISTNLPLLDMESFVYELVSATRIYIDHVIYRIGSEHIGAANTDVDLVLRDPIREERLTKDPAG